MSDLILDLESKFSRIQNKIDDKVTQINCFYAENVNKLNDSFNVEAAAERYSNGLNNQRDVLLNEEIEQRNSELSKANEFLDSNINPQSQINEFKRFKFIKSKKSFKILFLKELKFREKFNFVQLVKYRYLLGLDKYIDEHSTSLNVSSKSCPQTPLIKALYDGNLEIAQLLIESGADVNSIGIKNEAFLKLDAILGRNGPAALRIALERGNLGLAKFIKLHLSFGNTALIKASHEGYFKIAELLVENGADVNMKNIHSETALASSLNKANLEIAKLLINNGADVNLKNVLIKAVLAGNCDMVKLMIQSGADLNSKNGLSGETALTEAVTKDNLDIAKLLVESGADLDAQNNNGDSALIKAALLGQFDMAKLLIESGADVNIKNKDGNTSLIEASSKNSLNIARLLVRSGADVNVRNNKGDTALILVFAHGKLEIVKLLIENGADIDAQNENGDTALINASYLGNFDVFKCLIENNADAKARNNKGRTALTSSYANRHFKILKFMVTKSILNKTCI